MKVVITKTSDLDTRTVKEFSTIDELFTFMKECGHPLILNRNFYKGYSASDLMEFREVTIEIAEQISECDYTVEIYDDWRE